ncbi:hypothetical protein [Neorhizobium galegae]|uniref:Uncharacterized protein n=1 Tax=Neorhizobium galegae bv. orientalis str. HAMBI 540 TaxID=1028800 RepID=A0A068SMP2_NEOGA|nr:hypothetical protein [Neorhizobium galegae]MCQ1855984.1 hypothetical protein [Neorhizobium galegae]CDN47547.1 Hypothetical protein RG540_CH13670 [Neorhizobium galegae bv. orientalis str. HAMBI 540]
MPVSRKRPISSTAERVLHPTKGYRKVSVKRSLAATATAAIKSGKVSAELGLLRNFLQHGA